MPSHTFILLTTSHAPGLRHALAEALRVSPPIINITGAPAGTTGQIEEAGDVGEDDNTNDGGENSIDDCQSHGADPAVAPDAKKAKQ